MADVSIDGSISTNTAHGLRSVVFTSASVGYWFYIDSDGTFGYSKTTDGGATWGAQVEIASATTHLAYDVWFDQWTPGDSGTLIHLWYFDSTNADVKWRSLDTASDTLGTEQTVFAGASTQNYGGTFVSGTKSRSGYLYAAFDIDFADERGLYGSTDGGASWGSQLDATFVEAAATNDIAVLFPATGTGDNNDIWAIYLDSSTNGITLKLWDSSAGSTTESSAIMGLTDLITNLTGQHGFSASVRHSDGHLILAGVSGYDGGNHRVFDITSHSSFTELTDIEVTTDDHYHPAVFIDQLTNDIYVAFNGARDGSEVIGSSTKVYYTKSTDDGTTWSAGSTAYMEGAAAAVVQVWAPLMGSRFYVGWRIGSTLVGNYVNSIALTGVTAALTAVSGTGTIGSVVANRSAALTGVAGVGAVGTVMATSNDIAAALSGVAGTGTVGTVVPATTLVTTGVTGTGTVGTVVPATTLAITGVAGAGAVGTVVATAGQTVDLTGVSAAVAVGTTTVSITFGITGVAGVGAVGAVTSSQGASKDLTGVSGTGAVGTVGSSQEVAAALTGVAGIGAVGTVAPALAAAVTGAAAAAAAGSITPSCEVALTGVEGEAVVGSVAAPNGQPLTRVVATSRVGSVTVSRSLALSGVAGIGALGTAAAQRTTGITGVSAGVAVGTVLQGVALATTQVSAAGVVGSLLGTRGVTGVAAAGAAGTVSVDLHIALTGVVAVGAVTRFGVIGQPDYLPTFLQAWPQRKISSTPAANVLIVGSAVKVGTTNPTIQHLVGNAAEPTIVQTLPERVHFRVET